MSVEADVVGIWLAVLGGMLLGETIIVLTLYWGERPKRGHVVSISASYLILVGLGMQPALGLPLDTGVHTGLAIIAYLLGSWSLWRLVPVDAARMISDVHHRQEHEAREEWERAQKEQEAEEEAGNDAA